MPKVLVKTKAKKVILKGGKKVAPVSPSRPKPKPPAKPKPPKGKVVLNPMGTYTVNLGREFKAQCMKASRARGMALSKVVIQALKNYLEK